MKLEMICTTEQVIKRPKKPIEHFKKCPACGDALIPVDPDVICSTCSWDSTAWHVSTGAMDNLGAAAREFTAGELRSKMKIVKDNNRSKPAESLEPLERSVMT